MYKLIITAIFLAISFGSMAQVTTPQKTKFNAGAYFGLSIWKQRPLLALDLSYKGTTLRIMPNYRYNSIGITQELLKLSPVYYNLYWTASIYAGKSYDYDERPSISLEEFKVSTTTFVVNTGLKTYFARRMYSHINGGIMYNSSTGGKNYGVPDATEIIPFFECGIGVLINKTYPKLKSEEITE